VNPSIDRIIEKLRAETALCSDPWAQINVYTAVDAAVDAAINETKSRVLASAIAWGGEGQDLAESAAHTTRSLGNIGLFLAEACDAAREDDSQDERLKQVILTALANYASSIRWSVMLHGRPNAAPFAAIHSLYRRAESLGMALAAGRIVRDGIARNLNAESHYLRSLLLPVLCHESLDPQQIEIVDSWLWEWLPEFRLTRQMISSSPRLWIDLEGRGGVSLRQFMPEGNDVRHLVVSKLGNQIRQATESFHAGEVPGNGCSTTFPIEAHTGVLDHLLNVWDQIQNGAPKRRFDRMTRVEPLRVEALVGLPEIFAGTQPRRKGAPMRWMHVHDESEGGAALVVDAAMWETIWHGDIIGIRVDPDAMPHIAVVVRKFSIEDRDFGIGVEWIAREPRRLDMHDSSSAVQGGMVPILYVPGEEDSGRGDTILVDEKHFQHDGRYSLAFDERVFEARLNRLLRRGRGWVAAGYEITGVRKRLPSEMIAA
jgi:hypothetical protein